MVDAVRPSAVWLLRLAAAAAIWTGSISVCRIAPGPTRRATGTTQNVVRSVTPRAEGSSSEEYFAAPNGTAAGDGSLQHPWNLATALAQPSIVRPGATVWLRGGTYSSGPAGLVSDLTGSAEAAIVVRSYPGEFARIDGAATATSASRPGFILTVDGSYAEYRDFEVMSSSNPRPNGGQGTRPEGLQVVAPHNRFINLIVHDTGQGFGFWEGASDSEIAGCLIYYNGNSTLDHGVYANNSTGTKKLDDNIVFRNYGLGIHAYTTNGRLVNFEVERNVSFENGRLDQTGSYQPNFLLGSGRSAATSCTSSAQVAQNPRFIDNMSYHPPGAGGRELDLGYSTGSCNPTAIGNYLVGDTTLTLGPAFGTITISGNTFFGAVAGFSSGRYPGNSYLSESPTTTQVFVNPNPYEAKRANIVVYNWGGQSEVLVDVGGILSSGSAYEVRDAQNYFGAPVLSATFTGKSLVLPLAGSTPAAPVGLPAPSAIGPEFNVFVLMPRGLERSSVAPTAHRPADAPRTVPTRRP